jgi:hydroxymethylglutaryl-CoA lyase
MLRGPVDIREVGPRDGLQGEQPLPVADRVRLVEALLDAGVRHIEACSFVSPKAVPAMADAGAVLAALGAQRDGVCIAALVPNLKGALLALEAGVDELTVTVSASPAYNEKNVRMTVGESLAAIESICEAASVPVDVIVSCAFGSPFDEVVDAAVVAAVVESALDAAAARITLADTTGVGTPRLVQSVLGAMPVPAADVGLHLHDTRGSALVNAWAGLEAGVRRFDTAVGGLGGSPFAPGAGGNLATEDLVNVLDDALDAPTGIDLDRLIDAAELVASLVGHPVPSRVAAAGPRWRRS